MVGLVAYLLLLWWAFSGNTKEHATNTLTKAQAIKKIKDNKISGNFALTDYNAITSANVGQSCSPTTRCAKNSVCINGICRKESSHEQGEYKSTVTTAENKKFTDYNVSHMKGSIKCKPGHSVCGIGISGLKFDKTQAAYSNYPVSDLISGLKVECCPITEPNVKDYLKIRNKPTATTPAASS